MVRPCYLKSVMSKFYKGRRLWLVVRFLAWLPLPLVTAFGALMASLITLVPLRYASAYRVVLININETGSLRRCAALTVRCRASFR